MTGGEGPPSPPLIGHGCQAASQPGSSSILAFQRHSRSSERELASQRCALTEGKLHRFLLDDSQPLRMLKLHWHILHHNVPLQPLPSRPTSPQAQRIQLQEEEPLLPPATGGQLPEVLAMG